MMEYFYFFGIIVIIFLLIIAIIYYVSIYPFQKIRRESGQGRRTIFEIDTVDRGYEYYEQMLLQWLDLVGFDGYDKKRNRRSIKYFHRGCIYRFGLNYYRQDDRLIIETCVIVFKKEYPLVKVLHRTRNTSEESYWMVDQQHKDVYVELLQTLMNIPQTVQDQNQVQFVPELCISDMKSEQKKEKSSIYKLVGTILAVSFIIAFLVSQPFDFNKPKASQEDLEEGLQLIEQLYPEFKLEKKQADVLGHGKPNDRYFILYIYYGTINTPLKDNHEVMFMLQKLSNDGKWVGSIFDQNSSDIRWDLYYRQNES